MSRINCLILSKDRAPQLRLLLQSIKLFADGFFNKIKIIHTASDDLYTQGYQKLISEKILDNLIWVEETDFIKDFVQSWAEGEDNYYTCGIVDDCVFHKRIPISPDQVIELIEEDESIFCFSLRLGINTYVQNYATRQHDPLFCEPPFPKPKFQPVQENHKDYEESVSCVKWNWKVREFSSNFGYPISLDGHIFRPMEMYTLCKFLENEGQGIDNLRHWESQLAHNIRNLTLRQKMASFRQSCLVSSANNCVQDPPMTNGTFYPTDQKELNDKYLDGEVLSLRKLEPQFQNINSAHTEFMYRFEQEEK